MIIIPRHKDTAPNYATVLLRAYAKKKTVPAATGQARHSPRFPGSVPAHPQTPGLPPAPAEGVPVHRWQYTVH